MRSRSRAVRRLACSLWYASAVLSSTGCDAFDEGQLERRRPSGEDPGGSSGVRDADPGDVQAVRDAGPDAGDGGAMPSVPVARPDGGAGDAGGAGLMDAGTGGNPALEAGSDEDAGAPAQDGGDAGCLLSDAVDPCTGVTALDAAPTIDGVLDCGPVPATIVPTAWNGTAALPVGHSTQLAVAYRPDGLYLYVEVHGQVPAPHPSTSPIYCGDAIELYIDADGVLDAAGNYDVPGTMQMIVAAPASASAPNPHAERFRQGSTQGAWSSTAWQVVWLADGYALEAFVVAADLGLATWAPTGSIGLDLVIDVAGPASSPDLRCGLQLGQYFLRVQTDATSCGGEPWCDARAFCAPTLQ